MIFYGMETSSFLLPFPFPYPTCRSFNLTPSPLDSFLTCPNPLPVSQSKIVPYSVRKIIQCSLAQNMPVLRASTILKRFDSTLFITIGITIDLFAITFTGPNNLA